MMVRRMCKTLETGMGDPLPGMGPTGALAESIGCAGGRLNPEEGIFSRDEGETGADNNEGTFDW